jgi:hypothetical protein
MTQLIAEFRVADKAELNEMIDAAVETAHMSLADNMHGVLVTRHDFDHISVVLSPDVPFGLIREHDQARRP